MKIIITGNSGSGKTWLAQRICSPETTLIHLDTIFWEPGGFDVKRDKSEIESLIVESRAHSHWIAEGVFGELINRYLDEANLFIFLDMPWEVCCQRLQKRCADNNEHMERMQSSQGVNALLEWACQYYDRSDLRSRSGHRKMFESFNGPKMHLTSEEEVNDYIADFQS